MTTSIRQVLVHLDPQPAAAQRLKLARALVREHGAVLSALYATASPWMTMAAPPEAASGAAAMAEIEQERRETTRSMFESTGTEADDARQLDTPVLVASLMFILLIPETIACNGFPKTGSFS